MPPSQKTKWTDADLAKTSGHPEWTGLNRNNPDQYGEWKTSPDPNQDAYAQGDDLRPADGASIDDMLADAKSALASYGNLKDLTDYEGAPENQPRGVIRATSPYESLYWRAKDAIRPEVRDMVSSLAPLAVGAGGPLGVGAGLLTGASEFGQALQPHMAAGERALHSLFGTLAVPGGSRAMAYMAGKPTGAESALAAERAATQESIAGARELKANGYSHSAAGKVAGTPGKGKSSAVDVNRNPKGSDGFPRAAKPAAGGAAQVSKRVAQGKSAAKAQDHINDIWGPGGEGQVIKQGPAAPPPVSKAGASVPVHKDLRNIPESVYEQDLSKLGGRQGLDFEERAATDRRGVIGDVGESTYQVLLKMLGGRGDDAAAAGGANAAARAEQSAGVAGGSRPLGEPRQGPRRGTGVTTEQLTPVAPRSATPPPAEQTPSGLARTVPKWEKPGDRVVDQLANASNVERTNGSLLNDEAGKRTVMFGGAGGQKLGSQVVDTTQPEGQAFIEQLIAGLRRAVGGN